MKKQNDAAGYTLIYVQANSYTRKRKYLGEIILRDIRHENGGFGVASWAPDSINTADCANVSN